MVGWIDVERELEAAARDARELGEAPKLVRSEPVAAALELDRPVGAPPGCDRAEAEGLRWRGRDRPLGEHHRLPRRLPAEPAGRDAALRRPDPPADRDVGVVAGEDV